MFHLNFIFMKKNNLFSRAIFLIGCSLMSHMSVGQVNPQWLQKNNQYNSGLSPNKGPDVTAKVEWGFQLPYKPYRPYLNYATPAIDKFGNIYSHDLKTLFAFKPDRTLLWSYVLTDTPANDPYMFLNSSPAISNTGVIYTHINGRELFAVNSDGTLKWKLTADEINTDAAFRGTVIVDKNNKIYVQLTYAVGTYTTGSTIYIVNPDGTVFNKIVRPKEVTGNITIGADGSLYVPYVSSGHRSDINSLTIFNPDLTERITYTAPRDEPLSSPVLSLDGSKLYYMMQFTIIARNVADLSIVWQTNVGGVYYPPIILDNANNLYVGAGENLISMNALTGALNWTTNTRIGSLMKIITDDQNIYACDRGMVAISKSGVIKWTQKNNFETFNTPAIGKNNRIYVTTRSSKLFAFQPGLPNQWPMFRFDNIGSAQGGHSGIQTAQQGWSFQTGAEVYSTPVIDGNGYSYFGSLDGKFYSLTSTGALRWSVSTGGQILGSAAINYSGTIYVGSKDFYLYAFNPNGTLKWKYKTNGPIAVAPIVTIDGNVIVGAEDGCVYSISPTGTLNGKFCSAGKVITAAVVDNQGVMYVGIDNLLYAINPNMTQKWVCNAFNLALGSSPVLNYDHSMVFYCDNSRAYGIDAAAGFVVWQTETTPLGISATPGTSPNDVNIIIATIDGYIWKVNGRDGTRTWTYNTNSICKSGPIVSQDMTVYAPIGYNKVIALDFYNAAPKFVYFQNDGNNHYHGSPAMDNIGNLYFGSTSGRMYKLTKQNGARLDDSNDYPASDLFLTAYPNPVNDQLNLLFPENQCQFSLTNTLGTVVFQDEMFNTGYIDTSKLTKGLYILTVVSITHPGQIAVRKIIIE